MHYKRGGILTKGVRFNRPWQFGEELTRDELVMLRYATRCWIVQEYAGLSFEDARIYLAGEPPFAIPILEKELKKTAEEIIARQEILKQHVSEIELEKDLFYGFTPLSDEILKNTPLKPWPPKKD